MVLNVAERPSDHADDDEQKDHHHHTIAVVPVSSECRDTGAAAAADVFLGRSWVNVAELAGENPRVRGVGPRCAGGGSHVAAVRPAVEYLLPYLL